MDLHLLFLKELRIIFIRNQKEILQGRKVKAKPQSITTWFPWKKCQNIYKSKKKGKKSYLVFVNHSLNENPSRLNALFDIQYWKFNSDMNFYFLKKIAVHPNFMLVFCSSLFFFSKESLCVCLFGLFFFFFICSFLSFLSSFFYGFLIFYSVSMFVLFSEY